MPGCPNLHGVKQNLECLGWIVITAMSFSMNPKKALMARMADRFGENSLKV